MIKLYQYKEGEPDRLITSLYPTNCGSWFCTRASQLVRTKVVFKRITNIDLETVVKCIKILNKISPLKLRVNEAGDIFFINHMRQRSIIIKAAITIIRLILSSSSKNVANNLVYLDEKYPDEALSKKIVLSIILARLVILGQYHLFNRYFSLTSTSGELIKDTPDFSRRAIYKMYSSGTRVKRPREIYVHSIEEAHGYIEKFFELNR